MSKRRLPLFGWVSAAFGFSSSVLVVSATFAAEQPHNSVRWYKGNLHAHSAWSDGDELPEMVADWYKSHGYNFLALSEHNRLMTGDQSPLVDASDRFVEEKLTVVRLAASTVAKCQERFGPEWLQLSGEGDNRRVKLKTYEEVRTGLEEPGKFLFVQSEEITVHSNAGNYDVHINAMNLAEPIAPRIGSSVADTLLQNLEPVREQSERLGRPILAQVNHTNWSYYDISPEDLAEASTALFFEVYNAAPDSRNAGDATHPSTEKLWDIANTIRIAKMKGRPVYGIGSDDSHNYHRFAPDQDNPGRAWVMVRAKSLDAAALIDAMNRGDFYASSGVTLREVAYDAEQRVIAVEVQSEPGVQYNIEFIGTVAGADPTGKPVESPADGDFRSKRPGRSYSPEVGKLLSSVRGVSAAYHFQGNELYVRAVVRSDKPIADAPPDQPRHEEAWCQPVGWKN